MVDMGVRLEVFSIAPSCISTKKNTCPFEEDPPPCDSGIMGI